MDKEKLLCYLILLIGCMVGWLLKGFWGSVRIRMKFKKIKLSQKDLEFIEFREFNIKEIERAYGYKIPLPVLWNHNKKKIIDFEYINGKFIIKEEKGV